MKPPLSIIDKKEKGTSRIRFTASTKCYGVEVTISVDIDHLSPVASIERKGLGDPETGLGWEGFSKAKGQEKERQLEPKWETLRWMPIFHFLFLFKGLRLIAAL